MARSQVGDDVFTVRAARTGVELTVPADRTISDVLIAAGVAITVACGQGMCGGCLTRVLEGEPDHRDNYLVGDEQHAETVMIICCSRARTARLVLDL